MQEEKRILHWRSCGYTIVILRVTLRIMNIIKICNIRTDTEHTKRNGHNNFNFEKRKKLRPLQISPLIIVNKYIHMYINVNKLINASCIRMYDYIICIMKIKLFLYTEYFLHFLLYDVLKEISFII